jgi:hypothetical protein
MTHQTLIREDDPFLPTSIETLMSAEKIQSGMKFKVNGAFYANFTIIGTINSSKEEGIYHNYVISDGTATTKVRFTDLDSGSSLIEIGKTIYCVGRRVDNDGQSNFEAFQIL